MKKGSFTITTLRFIALLVALSWEAAPVKAQSVDDKIKALEQELSALKSQQMELKKEATAAAVALPAFSYRPGNGVNIEAADKSWGIRFSMETDMRMLFESGQDQVGRTNGEVMLRRFHRSEGFQPVYFRISFLGAEKQVAPGIDVRDGSMVLQCRSTAAGNQWL